MPIYTMGPRVVSPEVIVPVPKKKGAREPYLKSLPKKTSKKGLVATPQATRGKIRGQRAIAHNQLAPRQYHSDNGPRPVWL